MSTFENPVTIAHPPPDPPYFGENQPKTLRLYPLSKKLLTSSLKQITDDY